MSRTRLIVAPIVFGVLVLLLWQLAVVVFAIKPFVLPSPLSIGDRFSQSLAIIWKGTLVTGLNALVGLVVGGVLGILFAVLSALVRAIDQLAVPVVTALSVIFAFLT